jgi:uncharacterized protein
MTPDWSHSVDVDRLADARASHGFEYALADLPRLREQLAGSEGVATGQVEFRRERGLAIAAIDVEASLTLQCQRCMQPLQWPVQSSVQVALVDDLATADAAPEDVEPVLVQGGKVLLRDLVEEELLLGLPLIARHEDFHCVDAELYAADAAADSGQDADDAPLPAETTQTPFAGLGELLKRR